MTRFEMVKLAVLMVMMAVRVAGNFVVEENSLSVISPESLRGTYHSAIGNFGVPKYGGTLSGSVVYPAVNVKGCDKFPNDYFRSRSGARPNFALVDRGGKISSLPSSFSPTSRKMLILSGNRFNHSILTVFAVKIRSITANCNHWTCRIR